jgi:hypothetical protein
MGMTTINSACSSAAISPRLGGVEAGQAGASGLEELSIATVARVVLMLSDMAIPIAILDLMDAGDLGPKPNLNLTTGVFIPQIHFWPVSTARKDGFRYILGVSVVSGREVGRITARIQKG